LTFRLSDTSAYVRVKERTDNCKYNVPATLNGSSLYNIMPYAQFKSMQSTYGSTTGITPTLEKAHISFGALKPSPHRHPAARLPVHMSSGPTFVAQQMTEDVKDPFNGLLQSELPPGKKRSASPDSEIRKRNKSVEDGPLVKKTQTFEEPPWE
jgi:hypothetical protein